MVQSNGGWQTVTRALLALLLALAATDAPAQDVNDNADVRVTAQAFDDAQAHKDGAALERLLAPDFLLVRGSGRIGDRRDFIQGFTDPTVTFEPFTVTDRLFLRIAPDAAIVGGEAWVRGREKGKPFAEHFRFSDTFVRRDGRWLAVYTQVTPLPAK